MDLRQVSFEVIDDGCLVVRRRSNRGPFPGVRPGIPCSVHPVVTLVCSFGLALKGEFSGQLPTVSALTPERDIGLGSNLVAEVEHARVQRYLRYLLDAGPY